MNYFLILIKESSLKTMILFIFFDLILGILRSIKEKSFNSNFGINGMIRKVGMIFSIIFLIFIDEIININFIGFLPDSILELINLEKIGISDLFIWLFIIFESISILKNMHRCNLPIPKKLKEILEKILKEFTGEE